MKNINRCIRSRSGVILLVIVFASLSGLPAGLTKHANTTGLTGGAKSAFPAGASALKITAPLSPAQAPTCVPPPADMVTWLPGDGDYLNLRDTLNGGPGGAPSPAFATGKVGQGFNVNSFIPNVRFAGYVVLPNTPNNALTNAMTIDAWINPSTVTGSSERSIVSRFGNSHAYKFTLLDGGQMQMTIYGRNAAGNEIFSGVTTNVAVISPGVFTHVAATFDAGTQAIKIYVNGIDAETTPLSGSTAIISIHNPSAKTTIGVIEDGSLGFDGIIDEVELFKRALSQNEIQAIVTADSAGKCKPSNPCGSNVIFSAPSFQTITGQLISSATGDFNGDGKADLALITANLNSVSILFGNGDGTFMPAVTFDTEGAVNGTLKLRMAVGDFNGDGVQDLAVPRRISTGDGNGLVAVLLGNTTGTLTPAPSTSLGVGIAGLATGDFNGDGKADLVASAPNNNSVLLLTGDGAGAFAQSGAFSTGSPSSSDITVGDFNNDGKLDVATANNRLDGTFSILLGDGAGGFASPGLFFAPDRNFVSDIGVADFDRDGKLDIFIGGGNTCGSNCTRLDIYRGDGAGNFAFSFATSPGGGAAAAADFNGDGKPDLSQASDQGVFIYLGFGDGTLHSATRYLVGPSLVSNSIADFNRDGKPDLAAATFFENLVPVLLNSCAAGPLEISPASTTVAAGATRTFSAVGGTPPYTFSIPVNNSGGTITFSSGVYTAGPQASVTDTVRVTDSASATSEAIVTVVEGAPTKLAFTVQPSNTAAGSAISPAVEVSIQDQSGNVVTTATDAITIAIGANPGAGALSGTLTRNAVAGVAVFNDLSISRPAPGYTLSSTAGALAPTTSAVFTIFSGSPVRLAFTLQPSNTVAGSTITNSVEVAIQDQFGNLVTSATDAVTVAISSNPGAGTLSGTLTRNALNGRAVFDNLSINRPANGYTLGAASGTLTSATSVAFNIVAGSPAKLGFTVQPTNTVAGSLITASVEVAIQDQLGNVVTSATDAITVAIGSNPGAGTLSGTLTRNAANGTAVFQSLSINRSASGYTLGATSGTLTSATSNAFNIAAGPPAKLAFTVQPTNTVAGSLLTPSVEVAIEDQFGNAVTSATAIDPITIAISSNPGVGTLSGTSTHNAVGGVAVFSDLSINRSGAGYTLRATASLLTQATSTAFNVLSGPAAKLAFGIQPSNTVALSVITPAVAVSILDQFGNAATTASNAITVAVGANPGGGAVSGTFTRNAVGGIAFFNDLSINGPGNGYTLVATSGSLMSATSIAFNITQLSFVVTNTNDTGAGSLRQVILDANAVTGVNTITFNISGAGVHTITPPTVLPTITDPVIIDGTTQPGFIGNPLIELSGASVPFPGIGLTITGGNSTVKGLVINRFNFSGIELRGNGGNVVSGNYIGTNAAGNFSLLLGNSAGVEIATSSNNTIGGTTAAARNVISGNFIGILVQTPGSSAQTGNLVQGNFIGTDVSGANGLGNGVGVQIEAFGVTIGGTQSGARNVIAFNSQDGVRIFSGTGNAVLSNSIFSNGGLGINLVSGNNGQPSPSLFSAGHSGNLVFVTGSLFSAPNTTYRVELFSNTNCDSSGSGEGQSLINAGFVTTGPNGFGSFIKVVSTPVVPIGQFITATVTDPAGNTSEFSPCVQVRPTISGEIKNASNAGISGVTVRLTGSLTATAQTDANGHYAFGNLPIGGVYSVSPTKTNFTFAPPSNTVTLNNDAVVNFTGALTNRTISGRVTDSSGVGVANVGMNLSGSQSRFGFTNSAGFYSFNSLPSGGNYTVIPSKASFSFSPTSRTFNNLSSDQTAANFTGTPSLFTISGTVRDPGGIGVGGITINLAGSASGTKVTNSGGVYVFATLSPGTYTVSPAVNPNFTFAPLSRVFTNVNSAQVANFTATSTLPPSILNSRIAFASTRDNNHEIYVMNADGSLQTNLTNNQPAFDTDPALSPDGTKIAFTSFRGGNSSDIYVMNADGTNQTRLTTDVHGDDTPTWSPNGTKIAFTSFRDGSSEIFVMNPDGSNQTQLTTNNNQVFNTNPSWSPDGAKIVFESFRNGNQDIYVMNAVGDAGGTVQPTRLTTSVAADGSPAWSPDGSKIAFISDRDGGKQTEIYTMNAVDGSGQTRLTTNPAQDRSPAWSPDSTKIAFERNFQIFVMDANGDANGTIAAIQLTNGLGSNLEPSWSLQPTALTPAGSNVIAQSGSTTVTYSNVSTGGVTAINPIPPTSVLPLPPGYATIAGAGLAYSITTSATVTPPITVCFNVSSINDPVVFGALRILHGENGVLVDRTILAPDSPAPDFNTRTICARVNTLSPFIIAEAIDNNLLTVSGLVVNGSGESLSDVTVTLSGDLALTTQTDIDGRFTFVNLNPGGNYGVTPSVGDSAFNPQSQSFNNLTIDQVVIFTATLVLDSIPPFIRSCASDQTLAANADCRASVPALTGQVAADDNITRPSDLIITQSPAAGILVGLGDTTITIAVKDEAGNTSTCTAKITVKDMQAPVIFGASVDKPTLWPPNHKMVDVAVTYNVTDNCGPVTTTLNVTSNEPINGTGDGDTAPDWEIVDAHHLRLRAERSGNGSGRVYTITITSTDNAQNSSIKTLTVTVPKNQN